MGRESSMQMLGYLPLTVYLFSLDKLLQQTEHSLTAMNTAALYLRFPRHQGEEQYR